MRRKMLLWHFNSEGCIVKRDGGNYSVFLNILNRKTSTVPKRIEINDYLVRRICKDLDIKFP